MKICVSLDSLPQSIANLPNTFCYKVVVPDDDATELATITSIVSAVALAGLADHDLVSRSYMDQYQVRPEDIVTVVEIVGMDGKDGRAPISAEYLVRSCTKALETLPASEHRKLVIMTAGGTPSSEWIKGLSALPIPHLIMPLMSVETIFKILTNSEHHILTGCNLGWYGAAARKNTGSGCRVILPTPWRAGEPGPIVPDSWIKIDWAWPYSKYFDYAYYVNLDRRHDRRQHMERQLSRFGFSASRIVALDGKQMKWKPEYGMLTKHWNQGAFAYCLSYRMAIIDAIRKGYQNILVMDDDCVLQDNLWEVLRSAWKAKPEECHMFYLAANHGPEAMPTEDERVGDSLYRLKGSLGSHAIIINRAAFLPILHFTASPYAPLDMYFSVYQKFFPCYITYPGLATQLAGHSDILNCNIDYSVDWRMDYINHIASRASAATAASTASKAQNDCT